MKSKLITNHFYKKLITNVTKSLTSGIVAAHKALDYQKLKTYWTIGKKIREDVEFSNGQLQLNLDLYNQLIIDIENKLSLTFTVDSLRRFIQFNRSYPIFPEKTILTWTHYVALLRIKDITQRKLLEQKAIKENLSVLKVKEIVRKINIKDDIELPEEQKKLKEERGVPFLYELKQTNNLLGEKELKIDCGFKIDISLAAFSIKNNLSPKTFTSHTSCIIKTFKEKDGYSINISRKSRHKIYTYGAKIIRIIDGDTIDVNMALGFFLELRARLRLKGINAPEMSKSQGIMAKNHLEGLLRDCPIIIVRTKTTGVYGRWLADIFALPGCNELERIAQHGQYINQQMLDDAMSTMY